jgi:hypothetical protein
MWITFWFNNLHFALEFFGAIVLFVLAWLAFDAYLIKKEFKTLSRALGFLFFAFWFTIHSLNITNDSVLFFAVIGYLLGLLFIFLNLYWEKPPIPSKFEAVLILPAAVSILWQVHILATILLIAITISAIKRYQREIMKSLKPFWIAFSLLALASILAIFNSKTGTQGFSWIGEHVFKFIGFGFLGYWGWQYLKLRIKEEMLLIFVGMALFIAVIVTFTFSAILLKNMESETKANLISNVKVLNYTLSRMKNETLSNAQIFAKDEEIENSLEEKDFGKLEEKSQQLMAEKSMDFFTIADEKGEVILRAHSVTAKGDNIKEEKAGGEALQGNSYVTIEPTLTEKFSIRGAAPIYNSENNLIGAVITGFIIDNAFADQIKKTTGLEATIYKEDTVQATTIFDPVGKTRNVGTKQTDVKVVETVLQEGQGITTRTMILSRPYLAAYLPLKNTEGEIIGMFQASRLQIELFETAATANRLTLLVTIIIVIMALMPAYLVVKRITQEV